MSFLTALVTAAITALVALGERVGFPEFWLPAVLALLAILAVGLVTWRRLVRRNLVTGDDKRGMEIIRDAFEVADPPLAGYRPVDPALLFCLEWRAYAAHLPARPSLADLKPGQVPPTPLWLRLVRAAIPSSRLDRPRRLEAEDRLRLAFKRQGDIDVAAEAMVCTKQEGMRWLVKAAEGRSAHLSSRKRRTYLVRRVGDVLAVCQARQPAWGGLAEMAGAINSLVVSAILVLLVLGLPALAGKGLATIALAGSRLWLALGLGVAGLAASAAAYIVAARNLYESYGIRLPPHPGPAQG